MIQQLVAEELSPEAYHVVAATIAEISRRVEAMPARLRHDGRTPLTSANLHLESAQASEDPEEILAYLTSAFENAQTAERIIARAPPEQLNLEEIVSNVARADRFPVNTFAQGSKDLFYDAHPSAENLEVFATPGAIDRIIYNLIFNALEQQDVSLVAVDLSREDLHEPLDMHQGEIRPGRYGKITILDDGKGMTAEEFMRYSLPGISSKGNGRGHGLANVLDIAVEMKAGIIHTPRYNGAEHEFTVYIPESPRLP